MKFGISIMSRIVIVLAILMNNVVSAYAAPTFGPQSSNKNVEWDFDFVETFDGLSDWVRTEGRVGNVNEVSKMPKLLDGSDSAWGYFSVWDDTPPPQKWITAYGDNRVWRGDKSVAIDIGGSKGPSRFGLYMGEGYKDFYLFFMVNIPKNEFPTSCAGDKCQASSIGTYEPGKNYAWFSSWKFNTFNIGCDSAMCPFRNTYSDDFHVITHLQKYNYGSAPGITVHFEGVNDDNDKWALDGNTNLDDVLGDWFGLEYHVTQTATQTIFQLWLYDQEGNAIQLMENGVWPTPAAVQGEYWNQFFFGGNNSSTYTWGSTMQSEYYIDDVIIDDKRIGTKYFNFIKGSNAVPLPPVDGGGVGSKVAP